MIRPLILLFVIYFASIYQDAYSWSISMKPDSGHVRVNKTTTIMCRTSESIDIDDCVFKIDGRDTMEFRQGGRTSKIVVTNNGKPLYSAQYSGRGLEHSQCGLSLSNIAAGVYIVGCQMRDVRGSVRQEFMTLNVDNNLPLRVKVNRKYQTAAPASEVAVLCSTERRQPLDHCAIRLPSKQWVLFQQGHQSKETEHYHYHGRGLDKGHCGVNLVNVTKGDSGLVLCHLKAGLKSAVRAVIVKVAKPKPETEISWNEKPHMSPGDILEAECVLKGAYPLPPMVWHFQSKMLNRSEVEETTQESTFRWPWEDHIIRQKVALRIGNQLGAKTLTCSADEAGELTKSEVSAAFKYTDPNPNELLVFVNPKCGMRTSSKYHFTNKSERMKRAAVATSKGGNNTENAPNSTSTASPQAPKTATSRPTKGTLPGEDADYEEPVWDEIDVENGPRSPVVPTEDEPLEMPPATGVVGGQPVFVADEEIRVGRLPVSTDGKNGPRTPVVHTEDETIDLKPTLWMRGGAPIFVAPGKKPAEQLPVSIDFKNPTRRPEISIIHHEVSAMVGAQPVLMAPERVPLPVLAPPVPRPVIPPGSIVGGQPLLTTQAFGKLINRSDTGSFLNNPHLQSVGGTEIFKVPMPQSAGGTEIFQKPRPFLSPSVGGIEILQGSRPSSVGGTDILQDPDFPNVHYSAGGTTVFNSTHTEVEFWTYPWTAGIYKMIKGKYSQQCGGTLVTETHVICAAHCFWDEHGSKPTLPEDYMVALGKVMRDWDTGDAMVQRRRVRRLHIHPVFRGRKRNFQHDISVIELVEKVDFTSRVAPACLDWDNDLEERQLRRGIKGVVTGWGYTEDEKPSEILRFVELPYVDINTCYDKLPQDMQLLLTTDKFCAGISKGNTSVCPGDSGGGFLVLDDDYDVYFLRGIVSVAFRPPSFVGNCYYSEVSGFTLVSQSLPWLRRILNYND